MMMHFVDECAEQSTNCLLLRLVGDEPHGAHSPLQGDLDVLVVIVDQQRRVARDLHAVQALELLGCRGQELLLAFL